MTTRPIVTYPDPILRRKAKKVHRFDSFVSRLLDEMLAACRQHEGLGLAAPQVGVPLRVIVIDIDDASLLLINPEIVETGGDEVVDTEGCLSLPGYLALVQRWEHVTVKARDRHGRPVKVRSRSPLEARVLQHEINHLDGVLIPDRAVPPEDMKEAV